MATNNNPNNQMVNYASSNDNLGKTLSFDGNKADWIELSDSNRVSSFIIFTQIILTVRFILILDFLILDILGSHFWWLILLVRFCWLIRSGSYHGFIQSWLNLGNDMVHVLRYTNGYILRYYIFLLHITWLSILKTDVRLD